MLFILVIAIALIGLWMMVLPRSKGEGKRMHDPFFDKTNQQKINGGINIKSSPKKLNMRKMSVIIITLGFFLFIFGAAKGFTWKHCYNDGVCYNRPLLRPDTSIVSMIFGGVIVSIGTISLLYTYRKEN